MLKRSMATLLLSLTVAGQLTFMPAPALADCPPTQPPAQTQSNQQQTQPNTPNTQTTTQPPCQQAKGPFIDTKKFNPALEQDDSGFGDIMIFFWTRVVRPVLMYIILVCMASLIGGSHGLAKGKQSRDHFMVVLGNVGIAFGIAVLVAVGGLAAAANYFIGVAEKAKQNLEDITQHQTTSYVPPAPHALTDQVHGWKV